MYLVKSRNRREISRKTVGPIKTQRKEGDYVRTFKICKHQTQEGKK